MIVADCTDCGSIHAIGARPVSGPTTACPDCSARSYGTYTIADAEDLGYDVLERAVAPVSGVGPATAENIREELDSLSALFEADRSTLTGISGVGEATVDRLDERLGGDRD